jgi:hypothetical protein
MTTASEEYLKRRVGTAFLPLAPLHHQAMDRIFSAFSKEFSFDDALQLIANEPAIVDSTPIAGNAGRLKLLVIRVVDGLAGVGMIVESEVDEGTYTVCWKQPPGRGE